MFCVFFSFSFIYKFSGSCWQVNDAPGPSTPAIIYLKLLEANRADLLSRSCCASCLADSPLLPVEKNPLNREATAPLTSINASELTVLVRSSALPGFLESRSPADAVPTAIMPVIKSAATVLVLKSCIYFLLE